MITTNNFWLPSMEEQENPNYHFEFCRCCEIRSDCELLDEFLLYQRNHPNTNELSYGQEGCSKMCGVGKVRCGSGWVADGIGEHYMIKVNRKHEIECEPDRWKPEQPVLISAQTGRGKNTFIEEELIPYVRNQNIKNGTNYKVLILSNRIALRYQVRNRIKSNLLNEDNPDEVYMFKNYDCVDIMNYQTFLNKAVGIKYKQEKSSKKYLFVICDEAHFFTSDAMFNYDTGRILTGIVSTFSTAIRVYMTATPYECLDVINQYEGKFRQQPVGIVMYHFKRNYTYLNMNIFSEYKELKDVIIKSVTEGEKWIVFIDNIEKGQKFKEELESCPELNEKVFAVNASSKRDEKYQKMVLNETFDSSTKILITTSVLDNGVNFRGVQNVVVSDLSKTKCLQMVGRARVDENNPKVNLYIRRFNAEYIEQRIAALEEQRDAYHIHSTYPPADFIEKYFHSNRSDIWNKAKQWFGTENTGDNRHYSNEIAVSLADKLVVVYNSILSEMLATDADEASSGQKYLEHQLSWFGKSYELKEDVTLFTFENAKREFTEFLDSYIGTLIPPEAQDEFIKRFTVLCDNAFSRQDKNKNRGDYGKVKMNRILKDKMPNYEIVSKKSKKVTSWNVVKLELENEAEG